MSIVVIWWKDINLPKPLTSFPKRHPKKVRNEARNVQGLLQDILNKEERNWRRDVSWITIDKAEAECLDDGISVEKTQNWYTVQVSIADPTQLAQPGSLLFWEALKRMTSIYIWNVQAYHMFPREISTDAGSLNHNKNRLTLTIEARINNNFEVEWIDIFPSIFYNKSRTNHKAFQQDFINTASWKYEEYAIMHELARWLFQVRGAEERIRHFNDIDRRIIVGERILWHSNSHIASFIIEEFMVLANSEIAKFCKTEWFPWVYRVHMPDHTWSKLPKHVESAYYSTKALSHLALWVNSYSHFTSPLRRMADFFLHMNLLAHLCKKDLPINSINLEVLINHLNRALELMIIAQRQELVNMNWLRVMRKHERKKANWEADWNMNWILDHVQYVTGRRNLVLSEVVRKDMIKQMQSEEKINGNYIERFLFSKEKEIIMELRDRIMADPFTSRYISIFQSTWRITIKQHNNKKWVDDKGYKITISIKGEASRTFSKGWKTQARKHAYAYIFDSVLSRFDSNE